MQTINNDDPRLRLALRGGRLAAFVETFIKLRNLMDVAEFEDREIGHRELMPVIDWLSDLDATELVNLQVLCKSAWDKAGEKL